MFINISGYNINYIDEGTGTLVLFLHGWGASHECFSLIASQIKSNYRVVALDLPGFGESGDLKKSFSVDDYVDIVINFVTKILSDDKSNIEKNVILVGHSYGGRIIIKLNSIKNLPFKICKNVLIDAAGIKDKKDFKTKSKIYLFKTLKKIMYTIPISLNKKIELETALKKKFGSSDYSTASKIMQDTLVKSVNEDLSPYLSNMNETLLIWGDKDSATPLWMAKQMEKNINNAGLVILNGGHFSFLDDKFTFLSVMKSYLNIL